jgi:hypothetical protein
VSPVPSWHSKMADEENPAGDGDREFMSALQAVKLIPRPFEGNRCYVNLYRARKPPLKLPTLGNRNYC